MIYSSFSLLHYVFINAKVYLSWNKGCIIRESISFNHTTISIKRIFSSYQHFLQRHATIANSSISPTGWHNKICKKRCKYHNCRCTRSVNIDKHPNNHLYILNWTIKLRAYCSFFLRTLWFYLNNHWSAWRQGVFYLSDRLYFKNSFLCGKKLVIR